MKYNNNLDEGLDEQGFIASPADYIFGLGNKAKKAEKKIKKAEKALDKGNVKKAERKLDKAEKKISKSGAPMDEALTNKLLAADADVTAYKQQQDELSKLRNPVVSVTNQQQNNGGGYIEPLDPIAQGAGASIPGSGSLNQSGGGDISGGELTGEELASSLNQSEQPTQDVTSDEPQPADETTKSKNTGLIIIVVLAVIIGAYFYFKKHKTK
jgi:hypothetical protein